MCIGVKQTYCYIDKNKELKMYLEKMFDIYFLYLLT